MTESNSNYHHGNLRLALLDAAVDQIKQQGVEKLSLRGIARTVGVSQTAPYRHFKDKFDLLAEIATQAFNELRLTTLSALDKKEQASHNLNALGFSYIQFAISNPEKYKLMFGPSIQNRSHYPNMVAAGESAFQVLLDHVELGIAENQFLPGCPLILAHTLWTQAHGSASLIIDGFYQNRELPMPFDDFIKIQTHIMTRAIQVNPNSINLNSPDF